MTKTDNVSLDEISEVLGNLKLEARQRFRAEIKGVFGSYVRGEQKEGSDLDVLVEFEKDANLLDLTGLADFLEEKLNIKVDVVPESALREEIRSAVLKEKVAV
ncbi:MAG: nucleotidyltransferase family protein [Nitrospirae bacterium]|nr:nucleotidyltransferase family protein [Nitrospirota bacterium]MDA8214834.1 nucleotidyltransferase family protein [Nitrospiraceae bacterium]